MVIATITTPDVVYHVSERIMPLAGRRAGHRPVRFAESIRAIVSAQLLPLKV